MDHSADGCFILAYVAGFVFLGACGWVIGKVFSNVSYTKGWEGIAESTSIGILVGFCVWVTMALHHCEWISAAQTCALIAVGLSFVGRAVCFIMAGAPELDKKETETITQEAHARVCVHTAGSGAALIGSCILIFPFGSYGYTGFLAMTAVLALVAPLASLGAMNMFIATIYGCEVFCPRARKSFKSRGEKTSILIERSANGLVAALTYAVVGRSEM